MKRKYECGFWVGDDHDELAFESEHRAGSKANREDCLMAIRRRFGRYIWKRAEIDWIQLARA